MHTWFMFLITIYFYNSSYAEDLINCNNVGIWSSWSAWQNVVPSGHYGLYSQLRRRFCRKNPPNCTTTKKLSCNSFNAEVRLCGTVANFSLHCPNESAVYG
uniref:Bm13509, isoform b n=1 Tax=Brugia malayi TaxID=6279 RepID=A0A1I9G3N2_BRUMA|nr:Bm13509, isoform b [Brugia malayi]